MKTVILSLLAVLALSASAQAAGQASLACDNKAGGKLETPRNPNRHDNLLQGNKSQQSSSSSTKAVK
jgi:hypothetical protein